MAEGGSSMHWPHCIDVTCEGCIPDGWLPDPRDYLPVPPKRPDWMPPPGADERGGTA